MAAIAGPGGVEVDAGTTALTAASTYTGDTLLLGGTLLVNGSITSLVRIAGGKLGGSGSVGAVTVETGGTLAPGNSIGTLSVGVADLFAGRHLRGRSQQRRGERPD